MPSSSPAPRKPRHRIRIREATRTDRMAPGRSLRREGMELSRTDPGARLRPHPLADPMNSRRFLLLFPVFFLGAGCIHHQTTSYRDEARVPVTFENDEAGRVFYEALSRVPSRGASREGNAGRSSRSRRR